MYTIHPVSSISAQWAETCRSSSYVQMNFSMHVCTCLCYHCIYLGMFLSIFIAIAVADLTKFLHDMMLCCKYQHFIVNKYLWIQKVENRHSYPYIHLRASQDNSVCTGTGRIIRVSLLAAREFSHFCYIQTSCGTCPCACAQQWALRKPCLWVNWLQTTCQSNVESQNV
jgi:hypothetical protein